MKKILLSLILGFGSLSATDVTSELAGKQVHFLLPIDWTDYKNINLHVAIPEGFKPLQPSSQWDKASIIEFIPNEESAEAWTEIITVMKILGKKMSSAFLMDELKKGFKQTAPSTQLWLEEKAMKEGYEISHLGLSYHLKNKFEVFGAEAYSGPVDCVGIQYTIRTSEKLKKEAMAKIQSYFKNNVQVINPILTK